MAERKRTQAPKRARRAVKDTAGDSELNAYVASIIDPESGGPRRYPDSFAEDTSLYMALNNFSIPVCLNKGAGIQAGSYYVEVHPEVDASIKYLHEKVAVDYFECVIDTQSNVYGFYPRSAGVRAPADAPLQLYPNQTYDVAVPFRCSDDGCLQPVRTTGNGWLYPAIGHSGATPWVTSSGTLVSTFTGSGTGSIVIELIDDLGVPRQTITVPYNFGLTPVLTNISNLVASQGGLAAWGLTIVNNPTSGVVPVKVSMNFQLNAGLHRLTLEPLKDLVQVRDDIEKVRITAQSALLTYLGPQLTAAGQSTALLYRGGIPAALNSLYDYSSISETKNSFSGALKDGTYTYWEPMDTVDMAFRSPYALNEQRRPYMIHAGVFNDLTTVENVLRLRIHTAIEFTSTSQIYEMHPSPVRPDLLAAIAIVLQGVPNAMENGKHWDKIKSILSKTARASAEVGKFLWSHRASIAEAVAAIAPVAGAVFI